MSDFISKLGKNHNGRKSIIILLFFITACVCGNLKEGYAKEPDFSKDVIVVKDEKEMMQKLLKGMKAHQPYFAFYYPGIGSDFMKYYKSSEPYADFWGKLHYRDGYIMGVVSDSRVTLYDSKSQYVTFRVRYFTTRQQEKKIDKKVKTIVKKIGKGSRAVRIRKAHDYLVKHMRYDSRYYNPYYAFSKGRGVCMSYALAYQRILQEMKIPCVHIKGKDHSWNMVKIGSYWYNVDVTWDDTGGGYRYFLKSDSDFPNHKRPNSKWLSALPKAKKSYPLKKTR